MATKCSALKLHPAILLLLIIIASNLVYDAQVYFGPNADLLLLDYELAQN